MSGFRAERDDKCHSGSAYPITPGAVDLLAELDHAATQHVRGINGRETVLFHLPQCVARKRNRSRLEDVNDLTLRRLVVEWVF